MTKQRKAAIRQHLQHGQFSRVVEVKADGTVRFKGDTTRISDFDRYFGGYGPAWETTTVRAVEEQIKLVAVLRR